MPSSGPPWKMGHGWFWKFMARNCDHTQPRCGPHATSHQRQPSRQPNTWTQVPAGSQATSGNDRSGPARMFTASVVKAVCAVAAMDSDSEAAATSVRRSEAKRRITAR